MVVGGDGDYKHMYCTLEKLVVFLFVKQFHFLHLITHNPPFLQSFATFVDIQARIEARSKTLRVLPRMRRRGDLRTATPASTVISIVAFPFSCMNLMS